MAKTTERRPWVFPALKVDGVVHTASTTIPNTGQDILSAQQEAAKKIRQIRAAEAARAAESVPATGDNLPNSGDSSVDEIPVLSPKSVDQSIREWLASHLPSAEQLMSAAASMAALGNVENRVRDLVQFFKDDLDSFRAGFTSWFEGVQAEWLQKTAEASTLLSAWADQISEVTRWRDDLERRLFAAIADKRGPQGKVGNTGMAGAATTVVDRLPKGKGVDFTRPFLKRDAVVGDICIDATTDMRYGWRWDGQAWERGPAMTSLQVRDVRVSALNTGDNLTVSQSIQRTGGAGGGGGEVLIEDRASQSWTVIADSSNWSAGGFYDPTAGKLMLEITDLGDARRGVVTLDFSAGLMAGQTALTESAMTGAIFNDPATAPDVDFDVVRTGAPIIPAGVTGTPILSGGATQVRLRVGANLGGTKQYAISGLVWWTRKAEGKIANPDDVVRQPLWTWA